LGVRVTPKGKITFQRPPAGEAGHPQGGLHRSTIPPVARGLLPEEQEGSSRHSAFLRSFKLHVFPKIGQLPAEKVTLHEWLALLEKQAEARPGITDRILTNAKQMLKWGVKRRLIPADPLAEISARHDLQIKKVAGFRSLSHDEMSCHQW